MIKITDKNNFTRTALVAVVFALAGCGRDTTPPPAPVAHTGDETALADAADLALPAVIERRHFAIYSSYRVLFDNSPQVLQSHGSSQEDGGQQALMDAGSMPACSIRAMLLQD